jgi:hypothetical protein
MVNTGIKTNLAAIIANTSIKTYKAARKKWLDHNYSTTKNLSG